MENVGKINCEFSQRKVKADMLPLQGKDSVCTVCLG